MRTNLHVEAINLRHLLAWVTVVEEGSVTAGARKLGISQPALSQQLRALEDFFGSELLERLHRGVQPTQIGRALMGDARATLAAATRLARQAKSIAGLEAGVLEIATLPTLVDAIMIEPIRQWQAEYSQVIIRIKEYAQQSAMTESVAMGEADLAIGVRPPRWKGPVVSLGWEQFVVVLPPDDPLAGSTAPIALAELSDRDWILYEPSNGLADYVSAACALAGFRPIEVVFRRQTFLQSLPIQPAPLTHLSPGKSQHLPVHRSRHQLPPLLILCENMNGFPDHTTPSYCQEASRTSVRNYPKSNWTFCSNSPTPCIR
jgi:DNA-binding transcriptional LysR family regulator